ncbi:hypothetical protein Ciccas_010358 [Cichlidogyrus casuarinus]|uniref:Uncharacterized protein n=1 Tax=Cichlidogyrus casuarinus TaxID=1844966 RepID=A0ABD2PVG4_9PLAT
MERLKDSPFRSWFIASYRLHSEPLLTRQRRSASSHYQNVDGLWPAAMLYQGSNWVANEKFSTNNYERALAGKGKVDLQDRLPAVMIRVGEVKMYSLPHYGYQNFKIHELVDRDGNQARNPVSSKSYDYSFQPVSEENAPLAEFIDQLYQLKLQPRSQHIGNHTFEVCAFVKPTTGPLQCGESTTAEFLDS